MIDKLMQRVSLHTVYGDPDDCWAWSASVLPSGRPRLGVRWGPGRASSVTAARVIAASQEGLDLLGGRRWVARHTCDNVACVNPSHIISGTDQDNSDDMVKRGRAAWGNLNPRTKLVPDDVMAIRARLSAGETQSSIADLFGVSQTNIGFISRGKTWSWLK